MSKELLALLILLAILLSQGGPQNVAILGKAIVAQMADGASILR